MEQIRVARYTLITKQEYMVIPVQIRVAMENGIASAFAKAKRAGKNNAVFVYHSTLKTGSLENIHITQESVFRYVVAIDESPESHQAFTFAHKLMNKEKDHLHLVNVCSLPSNLLPDNIWKQLINESEPERQDSERILDQHSTLCEKEGIKHVCFSMRVGNIGEEIVKEAELKEADILVVGSSSSSFFQKLFFLDSTSEYVCANAKCSVLVVKPNVRDISATLPLKWMIAVDNSPESKQALKFVLLNMANRTKDQMYFINVFGMPSALPDNIWKQLVHDTASIREESQTILDECSNICEKEGFKHTNFAQRVGDVGEQIIKEAESKEVDFIILGSKTLTLKKMLLGSTTKYILNQSKCSVLIVKNPT